MHRSPLTPDRPSRGPVLRHGRVAALAVVVAVALGACSQTSGGTPVTLSTTTTVAAEAGPTTSTTAEPDAAAGKEFFVYAPVEGDCIDLRGMGDQGAVTTRAVPEENATPRGEKELILRLPCDLPHQYEVIAVVDAGLPGNPDEAALVTAAKQLCPPAFAGFIGTPYQNSELEVGWMLPSASRVEQGIQEIGCLAFDPAGKLVGSVRGSGR